MTKNTAVVTASEVREFYRADAKRLARLSEAAQATVKAGARGRLHAEAIAYHNTKRRTRQYVLGATAKAQTAKAEQRKALAGAGVKVGKRGPLSKEAKAALAQPKG